jgi:predicted RecB family nuclease
MKVRLLKTLWRKVGSTAKLCLAGSLQDVADDVAERMSKQGKAEVIRFLSDVEAPGAAVDQLSAALGLSIDTMRDLAKRGIKTIEDLAISQRGDLKGLVGVPANKITALIAKAAAIVSPLDDTNDD